MAISQLVSVGYKQSADRPSVRASFRTDDQPSNLQKTSDMFSDKNASINIVNMLQELNAQLQKLQETSKNTIIAFTKIIKDLKDVKDRKSTRLNSSH